MSLSLRTPEMEAKYQYALKNDKGRALIDIPAKQDYKYWKIVANDYPYDSIFEIHDLLLPKRVVKDRLRLKVVEVMELDRILLEQAPYYDSYMENTPRRRSVLSHFHIHLLTYRKAGK